jgi:selenide,water dikinase
LNPTLLDKVLKKVSFPVDKNTIVGTSGADDAGVYKISNQQALVQTLDFFTPIVDDPYLFGQIAAANSLSDIYAMGGKPISALNIVCFPDTDLDENVLSEILQGGADKIKEAEAVVIGGHSIQDKELKYGLSVTGIIHPEKVRINNNLKIGDLLLLTKPIGTGIMTTALKNEKISEKELKPAMDSMLQLNRYTAEAMQELDISACTDVTGFGLLGHLWEMMHGLNVDVKLDVNSVETFESVREFASESMFIPGGTLANINYLEQHIELGKLPLWHLNYLCDPQTSGGLLIAIPKNEVNRYLDRVEHYPFSIKIVGEVISGNEKIIF